MRKSKQTQDAQRLVILKATSIKLQSLDPQPTPHCAYVFSAEEAERLRRLDCRNYDLCLDYAIGMDWRGFGCDGCKAHDPIPKEEVTRQLSIRLESLNGSSDILGSIRRMRSHA